ncbi:unnamed protein product [Thlaspi arvense]|uniref:Mediator of RNA polymerase II transcription subunit 13 n=1 Tax=Thlaspi arvense TaxID=13288 RepID=A0AAU9RK58_THLAR|nr:unnamed protein product [Thlaspi arvense]
MSEDQHNNPPPTLCGYLNSRGDDCGAAIQTLFFFVVKTLLDDWLKTAASSLQLWEKAPLEPYALQKPMTYCVVCPDIDPLTTAAADFFQQLGTVYETCKLGTHLPHTVGNQMEIDSGKWSSSGFVLLDCPQSMKIESNTASLVGSISDYFLSLSNGWDLTSFLKSLSKALKALKLSSCLASNPKEGNSGPCTRERGLTTSIVRLTLAVAIVDISMTSRIGIIRLKNWCCVLDVKDEMWTD